jgi:hypothetical protein
MKKTKLKSILYSIATTIPPKEWNEDLMIEWAYIAAKKMSPVGLLSFKQDYFEIKNFSIDMPEDLVTLDQMIVYKKSIDKNDIVPSETKKEYVLRNANIPNQDRFWEKSNNVSVQKKWRVILEARESILAPCLGLDYCEYVYRLNWDEEKIKFNFKQGLVAMSYYKEGTSSDGDLLIPDNENFKEAILNYCMYRYYDKMMKAEPSQFHQSERTFHLQRYDILSKRSIGDLAEQAITPAKMETLRKQTFSGNIGFNMSPLFKSGF